MQTDLGRQDRQGRTATGGQLLTRSAKNAGDRLGRGFHAGDGGQYRNVHRTGLHLAMGKEGDGAFVAGLVGVRVEEFMECLAGRHGQLQPKEQHQGDSNCRPAQNQEMTFRVAQLIGNNAEAAAGCKHLLRELSLSLWRILGGRLCFFGARGHDRALELGDMSPSSKAVTCHRIPKNVATFATNFRWTTPKTGLG